MTTEPTSLTPEERVLAERLARGGPHAEPSPALDARVLAAARASVAAPPRGRPRWPALFGLAASLLLAVGIAWRLRPLPETRPATLYRTPETQQPAAAPMASQSDQAVPAENAAAMEAAPPDERGERRPEAPAAAAVTAEMPAGQAAEAKSAPVPETAGGARAAQDIAPPPPAPPSPPPVDDTSPQAFSDAAAAAAPAPMQAPEPQSATGGNEAARAASAAGDEPDLDIPPATADSPAVRDAWLQRIQMLVDAGDIDGARASLRAFVARYPTYTLPENLRALSR